MQGYLYEQVSEETIFYTTIFYAGLLCIVYYFMLALSRGRQSRHTREKEEPTVFVVATKEAELNGDVTSTSAASDENDIEESNEKSNSVEHNLSTSL